MFVPVSILPIIPNLCPTTSSFSDQASILSFFGTGSNAPLSRPAGSATAKQPLGRKRTAQDSKSSSALQDKEEQATTGTSQAAKRRRKKGAGRGEGTLDTPGLGGSADTGSGDLACGELAVGVAWIVVCDEDFESTQQTALNTEFKIQNVECMMYRRCPTT